MDDSGHVRAVVALVLSLAGCDSVFRLDHVEPNSLCPYAQLEPNGDEDHDGALNGVDVCPTVTNHDPNDEDSDGIPDACDLCPQSASNPGADFDCDMIGAACDPDDTIPHDRRFTGFGNAIGLQLGGGVMVADGALNFMFTSATYGNVHVLGRVPADAEYETTFDVFNNGTDYSFVAMSFRDPNSGPAELVRVNLRTTSVGWTMTIEDSVTSKDLAKTALGLLPANIQLTLRVRIAGTTVTADVSSDATGTVVASLPVALPEIEYGIRAYSEAAATSNLRVDVPYVLRIAPQE